MTNTTNDQNAGRGVYFGFDNHTGDTADHLHDCAAVIAFLEAVLEDRDDLHPFGGQMGSASPLHGFSIILASARRGILKASDAIRQRPVEYDPVSRPASNAEDERRSAAG